MITINHAKELKLKKQSALEAVNGTMRVVNVEDEPMNIKLITDKIITANGLKKVSSQIMYERGLDIPTVDGLFSEYIFGTTQEERMRTYAYIDLKKKFFHPYVYEVLKKLYRNIENIAAGNSSWKIDAKGNLKEIKNDDDPEYDEDATGMTWLVDNFHKIKFMENESLNRKEKLKFIRSLSDDEIFITKWIVIPVFYRDVDRSLGRPSIPKLNYEYNNLIKYSNSLSNNGIGYFNNKAMYNIQMTLVNIRKYGQSLIESKHGAFHKSVLGKSIDRGSRDVISVPVMTGYERPEENPVDLFHTGIPLSKCLVLGYPFIIKWCLDFFEREFGSQQKHVFYKRGKTGELIQEDVEIADQMSIFTKDYLDKRMEKFLYTYSSRFDPIMITLKDGKEVYMKFTGRGYSRNIGSPNTSTIVNRPMTWTDLFYMAAIETLSDKHVYCTRYPLTDYFGIFPSRCRPLSTIKTMPVIINETVYPNYPIIDINLPKEDISSKFIDTVTLSNLFLEAIGGDYDGDTISVKMVYSVEANQEAEEIMNSMKHFISIQGDIVRVVKNEGYLTFYNMTKN